MIQEQPSQAVASFHFEERVSLELGNVRGDVATFRVTGDEVHVQAPLLVKADRAA